VLFGYTRLVIEDWISDEQPIEGKILAPTPDWKHRMQALHVIAKKVAGPSMPRWDRVARVLFLGAREIKRYDCNPAKNQLYILNAFEEDGWPTSIKDPIPPKAGILPAKRLKDTIRSLNESISEIRFYGTGDGETVGWEVKS
jgi:hypothetical protein